MSWIGFAILGYFLGALVLILDKFLITSNRITRPAGYTFLTACSSLFVVGFSLFDASPSIGWISRGISLVSGASFIYGIYFLYVSLKQHQVSVTIPLVGMISSFVLLVPALVASIFFPDEWQNLAHIFLAFTFLFVGGFFVVFDWPIQKGAPVIYWKPVITSGLLFAFSYLLLKVGYGLSHLTFVASLVWSRLGFFLGGLSFLLVSNLRYEIIETWREMRQSRSARTNTETGVLFFSNKILGGISGFFLNGAIYLGPVGLVQAMDGLRFAFVFVLASVLSYWYPQVFTEKVSLSGYIQKLFAFILLSIGLWLASGVMTGSIPLVS